MIEKEKNRLNNENNENSENNENNERYIYDGISERNANLKCGQKNYSESERISKKLQDVKIQIRETASLCGRSADDILLIAVSKTVNIPAVQEAASHGQLDFGENRVQEYLKKSEALSSNLHWHFIGRLQTNKVRQLAGRDVLIHSLDRLDLLHEMTLVAKRKGLRWKVLVEVNVSGESSKAGVTPNGLLPFMNEASESGVVDVLGLMTVAPYSDNAEETRPVFRRLKELSLQVDQAHLPGISMRYLSMGMSNDYKVAIEEGATHIRVGTAIFGERMVH